MVNAKKTLIATTLVAVSVLSAGMALAQGAVTKEQVEAMALKEHPGKVVKSYKETKKGKEVWEVKVKGDGGKEYELYYDAKTGEPVK